MNKKNYMSIRKFCEAHDIVRTHVYVNKSQGYLPREAFITVMNKLFINEAFVLRRQQHKEDIVNANKSRYYELLEGNVQSDISRYLITKIPTSFETMENFIRYRLFSSNEKSILSYKVTRMHWLFYKYTHTKSVKGKLNETIRLSKRSSK